MAATRRLAAILAADVAGYSRLMGADEEGTHERLKAHVRELVYPKVEEHRGRVVKNTGDGFLAEFLSVVDAVRCAVEVQEGMAARNAEVPPDKRIEFRIGINVGDIIIEEGDIFGDGVNVAARLETLAAPGGICVSGTVRDHVGDRLPSAFEDMGEQTVKNIARPVRVFALRAGALTGLQVAAMPIAVSHRRNSPRFAVAVAIAGLLIIAISAWWLWPAAKSPQRPAVTAASSYVRPLVAPRLSIVVLPFANLSRDPDQQYFADGITEDLTTNLSQLPDMLVISRNTAFTYRNKPIDTKQIARELGVRYVLEGSVQRMGGKIRLNAQLINAETDTHLWAERFDRDAGDLFALQDEIARRIALALSIEMTSVEAARRTQNPDALDYVLRGRAALNKPASPENYAEALSSFEHGLELDPQSTDAQLGLAQVLVSRALDFGSSSAADDMKRAAVLADRALAVAPRNPFAHSIKGLILRAQRRCTEAIPEYETALALNHNAVATLAAIGRCKTYVGPIEEAVPLLERAIRLSPREPAIGNWYFRIGEAHLLQSQIDEAILWLEKALSANEALSYVHADLAAAYALKGDPERAAAELAEARKLRKGSWQSIHQLKTTTRYETPAIRTLAEATLYKGLRKAGMPEE